MFVLKKGIEKGWRTKRYLIFLRHLSTKCLLDTKYTRGTNYPGYAPYTQKINIHEFLMQPPIDEKHPGSTSPLLKKHK